MKVKDFIEWLKTQDQEATVYVLVQQKAPTYAPWGECKEIPFTPDLAYYVDPTVHETDPSLTLGVAD